MYLKNNYQKIHRALEEAELIIWLYCNCYYACLLAVFCIPDLINSIVQISIYLEYRFIKNNCLTMAFKYTFTLNSFYLFEEKVKECIIMLPCYCTFICKCHVRIFFENKIDCCCYLLLLLESR